MCVVLNPESQNPQPEVAHGDSLCSRCGRCVSVCTAQGIALTGKGVTINRERCLDCGTCLEVCLPALKLYGKEMAAREVFREVEKDAEFLPRLGGRGYCLRRRTSSTARLCSVFIQVMPGGRYPYCHGNNGVRQCWRFDDGHAFYQSFLIRFEIRRFCESLRMDQTAQRADCP